MFESIELGFTESGVLKLPVKGTTIFVGPNNSGKSLLLREIEQAFEVHPFPTGLRILKDYEIKWPTLTEVEAKIETEKTFQPAGLPLGQVVLGRLSPNGGRQAIALDKGTLINYVNSKSEKNWVTTQYLKLGVIRLDGRSRFDLTNDQAGGDLLTAPQNVLAHLFRDDATRLKVRSLVKDAFDLNLVIDPTNLGQLRIRLATKEPPSDEQSLNAEARKFHDEAIHIRDLSDGVQAFTGIVTAIQSGEFHTILIDEPEAFLHPPLAKKLGKNLASLASERGGSLMASTHSPDFLMGCVQASSSVRVVRLEYRQGKSRARMVDPAALQNFLKRPLMRNANVVSGLFHDGVVVVESDNDRVFYSEIFHRLSEGKSNYPSVLFINAQNKQTIRDIIGPLRGFGVPAAAITDVDILKDGGQTWTGWLKAAGVPDALHSGYGQQRVSIKDAFARLGKDMKVDGGVRVLDRSENLAAEQLFDNLEQFGVFTVRGGELENWLQNLAVPGKKTDWVIAMLERLGSDPSSSTYVRPQKDDVWDFMKRIVAWISSPSRKGIDVR